MNTNQLMEHFLPIIEGVARFKQLTKVKDAPETVGFTVSNACIFQVYFFGEIEIDHIGGSPFDELFQAFGDMFDVDFSSDQTYAKHLPILSTANDEKECVCLCEKRVAPLDSKDEDFLALRIISLNTDNPSVQRFCFLFYGIKDIFRTGKN